MAKARKEAAKVEKATPKKTEKPVEEKKGKAFSGPGVLAAIQDMLTKTKTPMNKKQVLAELCKRFPERPEEKMASTVKAQLSGAKICRMEKERKIQFVRDGEGGFMLKK